MNIFRILFYYRRRRKQKYFFFIFFFLIISSCICYWWIEINSFNNDQNVFEQQEKESENIKLEKQDPIYAKYIRNPYNINLSNIIKEANRKYQENNKYLVYSCRFMCGGKIKIFISNNKMFE